jgi:hypothetical protein
MRMICAAAGSGANVVLEPGDLHGQLIRSYGELRHAVVPLRGGGRVVGQPIGWIANRDSGVRNDSAARFL